MSPGMSLKKRPSDDFDQFISIDEESKENLSSYL